MTNSCTDAGSEQFNYNYWTSEEDRVLTEFARKGLPWGEVAGLIPGRTISACQTRWNSKFRDADKYRAKRLRENAVKNEQCRAVGKAIAGAFYEMRVPDSDPLLARLKKFHGKDRIYRNIDVRPQTATRRTWPQEIANTP